MLVIVGLRGRADPQPRLPRPRAAGEPAARAARELVEAELAAAEAMSTEKGLGPDRLHPLRVQLRDRGPARRPHARAASAATRRTPASQGYTCNKAMRLDHYQNGPHRLTSPMRRTARRELRGGRLGHGDRRDRRGLQADRATSTAASRSSTTAAAARETTSAAPTAAPSCGRSGRATARARWRRRRPARAGSSTRSTASHTRGEFEHAEVSVFIGKNPWMSQSFPRARVVLREIAKDPERSMIVIDPVVTDTAKLADFHLRVRPGTDAWCLAAMVGVLVQEDLVDHEFLAAHVSGARGRARPLRAASTSPRYAEHCGVDEALIRAAARRIAERGQRVGVRGPRHPAGAEQHALLLRQPDAVDPDRELRQPGRDAPAHVVREPVPRPPGPPDAGHRASGSSPGSCPAT